MNASPRGPAWATVQDLTRQAALLADALRQQKSAKKLLLVVTDGEGRTFGLFALDVFDDALHAA